MTNVIILAAGFGSRLLPLTKDKPKSLIEFDGKTLLERNIEIFKKHGINEITIVTGYKKEKINFMNVDYIENKNFEHNSTLASLFYAIEEIKNSTIILSIDDDGPGVDKSEFSNISKPFYKIDKSRSESKSSVGLGLSISSDIIKSHGGDIEFNKSKLGGLKVTISLPY